MAFGIVALALVAGLFVAAPARAEPLTSPPRACPAMRESGPVVVRRDGQVIANRVIRGERGRPAIRVEGKRGVVLRDLVVLHDGAPGVLAADAPDLRIEGIDVYHLGTPARGPNPTADAVSILCDGSPGLSVANVRLQRGSSGIYLHRCDGSRLERIEGRDLRGPFPRGQLVQWDQSRDGRLTDFSAVTSLRASWPEDLVNVYRSAGMAIWRGRLDGNNSTSGDAVMVDERSRDVTITDVDALRQMNGCFGVYGGGGRDVTMRRTRCLNTICGSVRGAPLSGSLGWAVDPTSRGGIRILDSSHHALCNPDNVLYEDDAVEVAEIRALRRAPRLAPPFRATLCSRE